MSRNFRFTLCFYVLVIPVFAVAAECGKIEPGEAGNHKGTPFATYNYTTDEGRALVIRQDMRVNADGARTAYQLENHGISYLCDGLTARKGNNWITSRPCGSITSTAIAAATEKDGWLHFSDEGESLCVFGFHVEGGKKGVSGCSSGSVVGDGVSGAKAPLIYVPTTGDPLRYFVSTTSLNNAKSEPTEKYIDSEQIPFVVVPGKWKENRRIGVRDYAYVYSPGELGISRESLAGPRGSFAIIADTGPSNQFGEGSIALHQMLVFGELRPAPAYQPVAEELHPELAAIYHPYKHRGDGDIRAKSNIDRKMWYILFLDSGDRSVKKHTFEVGDNGTLGGNVHTNGKIAAAALGGEDHIVSCLKDFGIFE